jgi:putative ATP-dependent endonuclease of the OLD family
MAKIYEMSIKNFRGISEFKQKYDRDFICLIGRGDSGKSTILEAISLVLSPNWNISFYDSDFHKYNIESPIEICVSLTDLPKELITEPKYGLYVRGLDRINKIIYDEYDKFQEELEELFTIKLVVNKYLEPKWYLVNDRNEPVEIVYSDRAKINTFLVADYVDRHFSWGKGTPLYSILRNDETENKIDNKILIEASRAAKETIDKHSFSELNKISSKIVDEASSIGLNISELSSSLDFRDISIKDGKICLQDEDKLPLKLKGKGTKRLLSIAIQTAIEKETGIILIDEIEQGLEPDRVQHLIRYLKRQKKQVFVTTHSRDVIVELEAKNLFLIKGGQSSCNTFDGSLQGCLRKNPEAFFAKKVIVCEGATEIGICRAIDNCRIKNQKENVAACGIRFADGNGAEMIKYCEGFKKSGFKVALFCDSDESIINQSKKDLKQKGIDIFDWEEGDSIELGIIKYLPDNLLCDVLRIASELESKEISIEINTIKNELDDAFKNKFEQLYKNKSFSYFSIEGRSSIGAVLKKGKWFKRIDKAERLGEFLWDHLDKINDTVLGKKLNELSNWFDD